MKRLEGIQQRSQHRRHGGGLARMEYQLQQEMHGLLQKEELMWFQRARTKWLTDGDGNTKFYHVKTVQRRRNNKIMMIKN
ncbi:unnamed protein product [Lathyrus sativus]|nr:unnamed protein product [Lathyrus sativus]